MCDTPAGSNDLNVILSVLAPMSHAFEKLGRGLSLDAKVMESIVYEKKHSSSYEALTQVLTKWLKENYPYQNLGKPSLSLLVKAVHMCDTSIAIKVFHTFAAAGEHGLQCTTYLRWLIK